MDGSVCAHGSNRSLAPGMFLGLALGKVLRPRVAVHRFRFVILTVASLSAVALIVKTLIS